MEPLTWIDANDNCRSIGGSLVTIQDVVTNERVSEIMLQTEKAWIGYNDILIENDWQISDVFENFLDGQPNNYNSNQDCAFMYSSSEENMVGKWGDENCSKEFSSVCSLSMTLEIVDPTDPTETIKPTDPTDPVDPVSLPRCLDDWHGSTNGKCIKTLDQPLTWIEAKKECEIEDASLVHINSLEHNFAIAKLVQEIQGAEFGVWIGYTDAENEGNWLDSNDSPASFLNWKNLQPNNFGISGQNCAYMYTDTANLGKWGDHECSDTRLKCICEMSPLPQVDPPMDSCLQDKLNEVCYNEDKVTPYARFDKKIDSESPMWRCYGKLKSSVTQTCVNHDGMFLDCYTGSENGPVCTRETLLNKKLVETIESGECIPYPTASCLQDKIDDVCNELTVEECSLSGQQMAARYAFHLNTAKGKWRCYTKFMTSAENKACINPWGERTNQNCSDPDLTRKTYCTGSQISQKLKTARKAGCGIRLPETTTTTTTTSTTTTTTSTTTTTEYYTTSRKPRPSKPPKDPRVRLR